MTTQKCTSSTMKQNNVANRYMAKSLVIPWNTTVVKYTETDKSNKTLNMFKHHLFHSVSLCRIKQSIINFDLIVIYSLSNMSCMVFHNVSNEPWNVNQYIYETPCIVVKHTCESYTFPSSIYSRHKLLITVVHMLQVFGKTWLILLRWLVNYILFKDIV